MLGLTLQQNKSVEDELLTIEQVGILRKVASETLREYPYRPLMLELALMGLSRRSLKNLTTNSFYKSDRIWINGKVKTVKRCVRWKSKNNVVKNTPLGESQWDIAEDYINWHKNIIECDSDQIFIHKDNGYWQPMSHLRIRWELIKLGRDSFVSFNLEIPMIHRSMVKIMRRQGIKESVIMSMYGGKAFSRKLKDF